MMPSCMVLVYLVKVFMVGDGSWRPLLLSIVSVVSVVSLGFGGLAPRGLPGSGASGAVFPQVTGVSVTD